MILANWLGLKDVSWWRDTDRNLEAKRTLGRVFDSAADKINKVRSVALKACSAGYAAWRRSV
jgi:hypothetical protein